MGEINDIISHCTMFMCITIHIGLCGEVHAQMDLGVYGPIHPYTYSTNV